MKEYVVVKFSEAASSTKEGQYKAWASYDGDIWGSPLYEVIDYYPTYKKAQEAIRDMKQL
tara:strand:+ start:800 stop:979 length:180 start_codon:yes stop_codon:yes gene_type:complete